METEVIKRLFLTAKSRDLSSMMSFTIHGAGNGSGSGFQAYPC
jgi:hypothetical protein